MKGYNIDIYDKSIHIDNLVNRARRFGNKYQDKKKLIIIDNLGLIQSEKFGIDRDDYLAAKIKWIADTTNSSVILVHHFTKEVARKANLEDGYRPRKEYLKGSTRILDYVQQALFVNLPSKYPDLLIEEKQIPLNFLSKKDIEYNDENFDKYLWSINPQRDKDTQSISDLRGETKIKLKSLIRSDVKSPDNKKVTFSYIVQKYTEYNNWIDIKNTGREERYKAQKSSIYTFIIRHMYNETYVTSGEGKRGRYLYGKNTKLRGLIDNLFIAENIKNRDDNNIDDKAIFRFIVDLGYNIFEEVTD
jgi:RecA-family ATPase